MKTGWIALATALLLLAAVRPTFAQNQPTSTSQSSTSLTPPADEANSVGPRIFEPATKEGPAKALQMIALLSLISLAPALILVCTCFTRFIVVFSFLKTGLSTQNAPPSQVLVGLALFMTLFVMAPVVNQSYDLGISPYLKGQLTESQALEAIAPPLRNFLLVRTKPENLELFYEVSQAPRPATMNDVPLRIAIPAFIVSELETAFKMGLVILLPFLVIDLVVAAVLAALGMVMLPPSIIALPIKLLVFISIGGWHLLVGSLLRGAMA